MIARISNMHDQVGKPGPHPIAYCPQCHGEFSANRGDYWHMKPSDVLRCGACDCAMLLVYKQTSYKAVSR